MPWSLSLRADLVCGSGAAESLVVQQLGHAGVLPTHGTAGLLGPQLDGPESGAVSIKQHQLLAAGSCHCRLGKRPLCGKCHSYCLMCTIGY